MPYTVKAERYPIVNPIRMVPYGDTLAVNINTWAPDRGFFAQHKRQWQYGDKYQQKYNYTDDIDIYIDTLAAAVYVHVYDEYGEELATGYSGIGITGVAVAGNVYSYYGTDYPYQSVKVLSQSLSEFYTMVPSQQILYIALECSYDTGAGETSRWLISGPLFFRKNGWPKTMLIEAYNLTNDYDVMFEAVNMVFRSRVEADITEDPAPAFADTVFTDMGQQQRKLKSEPYRLFDFIVGGFGGVPKYMLEKVNRLLALDSFSIDGVRYAKDNGGNWSIVTAESYKMYGAKIRLQEYIHDGGTTYDTPDEVLEGRIHNGVHNALHV